MKHPELRQQLDRQLTSLGLAVSENVMDALLDHLQWLILVNNRLNLTAVTDEREGVRLHLVDSLASLPVVEDAPSGPVLDIGTGGGFPGLPLAIATGREFTLLDSVGKKARVLADYVSERTLTNVRVLDLRSEQLAAQEPASFAAVVARAVAPLPSLLELASPLLSMGGWLIALKGQPTSDELDSGLVVAGMVGMAMRRTLEYDLPDGGDHRTILVYEKVAQPTRQLPRREGLAQRRPLA